MEVGDEEFAEGDLAIFMLDQVAALDLLELETLVEAPGIGMFVTGKDEAGSRVSSLCVGLDSVAALGKCGSLRRASLL